MNVTTYDRDWYEQEAESFHEVVIQNLSDRIVVKEVAGTLHVVQEPYTPRVWR